MIPDNEIISTHIFNYPKELLYKAWTTPELHAKWWGPNGFTNTFHKYDIKPGGMWEFTMHGPDGANYENQCRFVEIVENEKIVFDHIEPVHAFRVIATFEKVNEGTLLTFKMVFKDPEECQRVKQYIIPANEENFDRLEAVLKAI